MTQTIGSSFRMYQEGRRHPLHFSPTDYIQTPPQSRSSQRRSSRHLGVEWDAAITSSDGRRWARVGILLRQRSLQLLLRTSMNSLVVPNLIAPAELGFCFCASIPLPPTLPAGWLKECVGLYASVEEARADSFRKTDRVKPSCEDNLKRVRQRRYQIPTRYPSGRMSTRERVVALKARKNGLRSREDLRVLLLVVLHSESRQLKAKLPAEP